MQYIDDMNTLINAYRDRDVLEELITCRLNKSFSNYVEEIQEDFEDAASQSRIRVFQALRRSLKNAN